MDAKFITNLRTQSFLICFNYLFRIHVKTKISIKTLIDDKFDNFNLLINGESARQLLHPDWSWSWSWFDLHLFLSNFCIHFDMYLLQQFDINLWCNLHMPLIGINIIYLFLIIIPLLSGCVSIPWYIKYCTMHFH